VTEEHTGGREYKSTLSFVWSRLRAPVDLSTRYTTADIMQIGSTSATVELVLAAAAVLAAHQA